MRDELLGSVEDVLVAVPLRAGLHRRGVRTAAGLGKRVRGHLLAGRKRRAQPLFLLLRSRNEDRVRAERLHREYQRRAGACFRDFLDAHTDRDARTGDAAVLLGKRDAEDAVLREQRLDILRILSGLIDLGRARSDAVLNELADRVADRDLLGRELEIHL